MASYGGTPPVSLSPLVLTENQVTIPNGTGVATPGLVFSGAAVRGLYSNGTNIYLVTTSGTYAFAATPDRFQVTASGGMDVSAGMVRCNTDAATAGFFGSNGTTKPTVTGSKGANAAVTSLMTALSGLGLVTDSTS